MTFGATKSQGVIFDFAYGFPSSQDNGALRFLEAAMINDTTEKVALETLVYNLKSCRLWGPSFVYYPFIGSSAFSMKFNLTNPVNSDTANRIEFTGGWSFGRTGATPNGVNAVGNTFYTPSLRASLNGFAFGVYSRTNNTSGTQVYGTGNGFVLRNFHNLSNGNMQIATSSQIPYTANPSSRFFLTRRTSISFNESYRDSKSLGTLVDASGDLSDRPFYFGCLNNGGINTFFSVHEIAFGFLTSQPLSNTDALNLTACVNTFQQMNQRQI